MAMQLSQGTVWAGDYETKYGQVAKKIVADVARTDTVAKVLGVLPAGARLTAVSYVGHTASNAGTTAILDAGFSDGTGKELVTDADMKSAGTGLLAGTSTLLGPEQAAGHTITGKYAETGTASTTGGPWTVIIDFVTDKTT